MKSKIYKILLIFCLLINILTIEAFCNNLGPYHYIELEKLFYQKKGNSNDSIFFRIEDYQDIDVKVNGQKGNQSLKIKKTGENPMIKLEIQGIIHESGLNLESSTKINIKSNTGDSPTKLLEKYVSDATKKYLNLAGCVLYIEKGRGVIVSGSNMHDTYVVTITFKSSDSGGIYITGDDGDMLIATYEGMGNGEPEVVRDTNTKFVDVLDNIDNYIPTDEASDGKLESKVSVILTVITNIGMILAVLMVAIIGVKYMLGSVEEKAEYKKDMIPYLVGAFLLFGITVIVKVLQQIGQSINNI